MNLRELFIILIITICATGINAQSNTMYYHPGIPQAYYLNPATQPRCNVFVGIPIINSLYFENENTSLHLSDLLMNDPISGKVITPFHPNANLDDLFANFKRNNRFGLEFDFNPISFGFRINNLYFTSKTNTRISYPRDFMSFALRGNQDSTLYDFSGMGIHMSEYLEFAFGVSRKFSDQLTVGIRPKLLTGVAYISSENSEATLFTSHEQWQFDSHFELQLAMPGFIIPTNAEGVFDPAGEFVFDSTLSGFSDYRRLALSNKGFGIDLGIHFKPIEKLTLSASLIDLGFIKWKNYTHTAKLEGSYNFEGITYNRGDNDTNDFIGYLWDTIKGNFEVTGSDASFKTSLDPKLYVGGNYSFTKRIDAGFMSRFDFLESGIKTRLMIFGNWHPSSVYSLSLSYCPVGEQATTFGTAVSWRAGPIGFYTVFDFRAIKYKLYKYKNIPVFIIPANRSRFNFRFGMNVVIGSNQRKKLMKDKPMYYYEDFQ
jgi:hypothetical protein